MRELPFGIVAATLTARAAERWCKRTPSQIQHLISYPGDIAHAGRVPARAHRRRMCHVRNVAPASSRAPPQGPHAISPPRVRAALPQGPRAILTLRRLPRRLAAKPTRHPHPAPRRLAARPHAILTLPRAPRRLAARPRAILTLPSAQRRLAARGPPRSPDLKFVKSAV
jgi:hypothetical protein